MNKKIFQISREAFVDSVDNSSYVHIEKTAAIYNLLYEAILKPFKMVLLYGKPGTGKSMLLSKLQSELIKDCKTFLYKTPILDESEFYKTLAQDLYDMAYDGELNFTQFIKVVESRDAKGLPPIVMLDEAQLYSTSVMEKIRLLSDTRKIKFIIALHKTTKEDVIAKEHFQTRIWESFKLENASINELKMYIQKKLMMANCIDSASMFSQKAIKLIHKLTDGNYRETNKLLYTIFSIYIHYIEQQKKINTQDIPSGIIEMAALHLGILDA